MRQTLSRKSVDPRIEEALDENSNEGPTKADLRKFENEESECLVQKDTTKEEIDFEKVEKFGNLEDIEEDTENGQSTIQGNDLKMI